MKIIKKSTAFNSFQKLIFNQQSAAPRRRRSGHWAPWTPWYATASNSSKLPNIIWYFLLVSNANFWNGENYLKLTWKYNTLLRSLDNYYSILTVAHPMMMLQSCDMFHITWNFWGFLLPENQCSECRSKNGCNPINPVVIPLSGNNSWTKAKCRVHTSSAHWESENMNLFTVIQTEIQKKRSRIAKAILLTVESTKSVKNLSFEENEAKCDVSGAFISAKITKNLPIAVFIFILKTFIHYLASKLPKIWRPGSFLHKVKVRLFY